MDKPEQASKGSQALLRYHSLSPYRIREILLVSSEYDAFVIEEDGQLGEFLFVKYSEFYLVTAPRIIHAGTAAEAREILALRRIDLVLTTLSEGEDWVGDFLSDILMVYPHIPVALLVLDSIDLRFLDQYHLPQGLAGIFLWAGDSRLISAILNLIEDSLNVANDTAQVGVQVIITVEDSVSFYSVFLAHLYEELMVQSRSLAAEGVNLAHRFVRMLTRPKILLAQSYEEAMRLFKKYRQFTLAIITDVQFRCAGIADPQAGFKLARDCRALKPNLPILLQSMEHSNAAKAESLGLQFVEKKTESLRPALRLFLEESLGFGSFVFRMPDRSEVARARDLYELEKVLGSVDLRSIHYHAYNNHFNVWLRARSIFHLADEVERVQAGDFANDEGIRDYLLSAVHRGTVQDQVGAISDFYGQKKGAQRHFVKVGNGSIGGKGRGIAFMNSRLTQYYPNAVFKSMRLAVPRTVVLATECFDKFLAYNSLQHVYSSGLSDEQLRVLFEKSKLPPSIVKELKPSILELSGPLIVRSSSLLEDSQHQSCAGIYCTRLIPNNEKDFAERFESLCQAVFRVYMSTFSSRAKAYLENTMFSVEEEKMAVVIQEVVGQAHSELFYPAFAGVASSYNYYPTGPQKPEDGIAALSLGLGHMVAEGGRSLRFSPSWPRILPHLSNPESFLQYSQKSFYALQLCNKAQNNDEGVVLCPLERAQEDGTLDLVGSVFSWNDRQWREESMGTGPRAVTFNNILKWGALPLPELLKSLLERFSKALGGPVELEFAVDAPSLGQTEQEATLYLLQIRPLAGNNHHAAIVFNSFKPEEVLCCSTLATGHFYSESIRDIVYVHTDRLDHKDSQATAAAIGRLNASLHKAHRPYILIGPGRWGSGDPFLGIPVTTSQILGAKVIVELPYGDKDVEPSQGSHFFHELTVLNIGYITLLKDCKRSAVQPGNIPESGFLDTAWLEQQPGLEVGPFLSHITLDKPLSVTVDGRQRQGLVLKNASGRK